ncbi:MAG: hypothetical protein HUN05_19670 [Desulfobacter sp.]|nr:MAG: hypothetical protein HUN05_19670 [Desulfobacter sp.]
MVAFSPAHGIEIQVHLIPALVKYLLKQALDHAYATSRPRPFSQNDFKEQFLSDRELDRLNQFKAMKKTDRMALRKICPQIFRTKIFTARPWA